MNCLGKIHVDNEVASVLTDACLQKNKKNKTVLE